MRKNVKKWRKTIIFQHFSVLSCNIRSSVEKSKNVDFLDVSAIRITNTIFSDYKKQLTGYLVYEQR